MSLSVTLQNKSAAAISEIQAKAATTERLAAAYDATGYTGPLPWIVSGDAQPTYDGSVASLHFKKVAPDELIALLSAFPPVPRSEYKHNGSRSYRPGALPAGASGVVECDGVQMHTSAGRGYSSLSVDWLSVIGDILTRMRIEPRILHWAHPRSHRQAVTRGYDFIRFEGATTLHWGDQCATFNRLQGPCGLFVRTYASGSNQAHGDVYIRGRDVVSLFRDWEAQANARGEATHAAFAAAWASVAPLDLTAIATRAEQIRAEYAAKAGGLRAGTLEQTAALDTPHAHADKAVAEKHWSAYCDYHAIPKNDYREYFDNYTWACAYLKRCNLLTVPVRDEMRESAKSALGDTYRYGERWL